LVVDTTAYADNGANFFLNAGQRWLDRKMDNKPTVGRLFKQVVVGDVGVTFQDCRSILQVWIIDPTEDTRTLLEKKSPTWVREEYYNMFSALDTGTPLYYYPAYLRTMPNNPTIADIQAYLGYADTSPMLAGDEIYDGIIFAPPVSGTMGVEVWGHFYSPELLTDTQSTYWTKAHPEVLLMAAQRMMEVFKRNSEGVRDWDLAVSEHLIGLDQDAADEDAVDADQMEG
jgi:hypothetical protein